MIQLAMTVTMQGGAPQTFPVTPRVQVEFEREFKTSMIAAFSDEPRMEHLYWLGWKSMHAAGQVVKPFDGWLEMVDRVSPEGVEDAPLDL